MRRRVLLWCATGLTALLLLVVLGVAWIVASASGARQVLELGLDAYNEAAPGSIEIGEVEGRLLDRLLLRRLVARDRKGQVLVEIDRLDLRWEPRAVWSRDLDLTALRLGEVRIYEPSPAEPGFSDLVPSFSPPDATQSQDGLDLPLRVMASVNVGSIEVTRQTGEKLPPVTELGFDLRTAGPVILIDRLSATWNAAHLRVADAQFDSSTLAMAAFLRFQGASDAVSEWTGTELPPGVDIEADLTLQDGELCAVLVGRDGFVELFTGKIAGQIAPPFDLVANLSVDLEPVLYWAGLGPGDNRLEAQLAFGGSSAADWTLSGEVSCRNCWLQEIGDFTLELSGETKADSSLSSELRLMSSLGPAQGRGLVFGDCRGRIGDLDCSLNVDIENLHWKDALVRRVELVTDVAIAEAVTIDLMSARVAFEKDVYRLAHAARLVVSSDEVWVSRLALNILGGRVEVNGRLGFDLEGELRAVARGLKLGQVTRFVPSWPVTGTVRRLDLRVAGTLSRPVVRLSADFDSLVFQKVALGSGQVTARWQRDELQVEGTLLVGVSQNLAAELRLPVVWDANTRQLTLERHLPWTGHLAARGLDLGIISSIRPDVNLSGTVDVEATGQGTLARPRGEGSLRTAALQLNELHPNLAGIARLEADLSIEQGAVNGEGRVHAEELGWSGQALGSLTLKAELQDTQTVLDAQWRPGNSGQGQAKVVLPLTVGVEPGNSGLRWRNELASRLSFKFDELDLGPWLASSPQSRDVEAKISASGSGTLRGSDLKLTGKITGKVGHPRFGDARITCEFDASEQEQFARVWLHHGVGVALKIEAWAGADAVGLLHRKVDPLTVPIAVATVLRHFDLALLAALLPAGLYDPRGSASGRFELSGTPQAPVLSGRLAVSKGEVSVVALQSRLRNVEALAVLEDNELRLERLSFTSGAGTAQVSGRLTLTGREIETATAVLELQGFPFVRPGLPKGTIDTVVRAELDNQGEARDIEIKISKTQVEIAPGRERSPTTIPSSDAVRFVDDLAVSPRSVGQEMVKERKPLRLTVSIVDPAEIRGAGIDMSWTGKVTLRDEGASRRVAGRVTAARGRFELLGNSFTLERGEISLPSSTEIDPYIDLLASTEVDGTRVEARVNGRLSRPDISFVSDPPMSQPQIMALLVTGRADIGEQDMDSEKMRTKAASLLLAFNNPVLEQKLGSKIKVDRIKVGLGERADEPIVGLGKWLSRKLYVESVYHHNAPSDENRATARVEYHFRPRWSIETFYGDANVGGIDLFWSKKFEEEKGNAPGQPDASVDAASP